MNATGLFNQDVTIVSRALSTRDKYGDQEFSETSTTVRGYVEQRQRSEQGADDAVERTEWLLMVPADTSIDADARVEVDGVQFEVVGPPWPVRNPRTRVTSHLEATLVATGFVPAAVAPAIYSGGY